MNHGDGRLEVQRDLLILAGRDINVPNLNIIDQIAIAYVGIKLNGF